HHGVSGPRQTRKSISMSVDSRSPLRALRRKKEDERPDYSEPDFTGWGAKLDDFIPATKVAPAKAQPPLHPPPLPSLRRPNLPQSPSRRPPSRWSTPARAS